VGAEEARSFRPGVMPLWFGGGIAIKKTKQKWWGGVSGPAVKVKKGFCLKSIRREAHLRDVLFLRKNRGLNWEKNLYGVRKKKRKEKKKGGASFR